MTGLRELAILPAAIPAGTCGGEFVVWTGMRSFWSRRVGLLDGLKAHSPNLPTTYKIDKIQPGGF